MPELPEVESLRRALQPDLAGSVVRQARLLRPDMLHRNEGGPPVPLPVGARVRDAHRHGKQLAIETEAHGCLLVHLGMSGSLRRMPDEPSGERHVHACWCLERTDGSMFWLRHRDPRRFGWLESHGDMPSVRRRCWSALGPDALNVDASALGSCLAGSRRPLKAALLDQERVAGLGNIYVDESLFRAGLHPLVQAGSLRSMQVRRLAECIRWVLRKAVAMGGSTIQDHRTADGTWGSFQRLHRVYGRAGLPCLKCGNALKGLQVTQRATVFCPRCQSRRRAPG